MKVLNGETLLMGDLSVDIIGSQRNFFDNKNLLLSCDLDVQNIEPTRVTKISSTCIDHIIAAEETQVTTINCTISDHYGFMSDLKIFWEKQNVDSYQSDFNYDLPLNDDYCLKFLFSLKNRLNKIDDDDPDLYIIEMTQILIDEYCSKKIRKTNKNNHPWINLKIRRMMNNPNVLHKNWVQTPSIENRKNFTSCRKIVIKAIRVSKRRYYDNMITRKKNSSGIFDALKHFCGKKNVNTALFDVNVFNEHFATIGEKLTEDFKQNVNRSNFPVNKNTFVLHDTNW